MVPLTGLPLPRMWPATAFSSSSMDHVVAIGSLHARHYGTVLTTGDLSRFPLYFESDILCSIIEQPCYFQ